MRTSHSSRTRHVWPPVVGVSHAVAGASIAHPHSVGQRRATSVREAWSDEAPNSWNCPRMSRSTCSAHVRPSETSVSSTAKHERSDQREAMPDAQPPQASGKSAATAPPTAERLVMPPSKPRVSSIHNMCSAHVRPWTNASSWHAASSDALARSGLGVATRPNSAAHGPHCTGNSSATLARAALKSKSVGLSCVVSCNTREIDHGVE